MTKTHADVSHTFYDITKFSEWLKKSVIGTYVTIM